MKNTSTRLFTALLGYVSLIILLMTLNPFYLAWPEEIEFKFDTSLENLILNIVLFLPVGYLYRLITGGRGALLVGAALSLGIEITQLLIPARTTSVIDVLANTAGAGLGSLLCQLISARMVVSATTLNRMRLETPLMGLMYLLVPLLWIDSLALREAPYHWILTALLGSIGAITFSDLFRHWSNPMSIRVAGNAALAAGLWFVVGIGPRLFQSSALLNTGLGVMVLTLLLSSLPRSLADRRFEPGTLRRVLPVFVLYLLLLSFGFPLSSFGGWHGFFGFTDRASETSLYALYARLEYLAAFTVLGYLTAEWRGRLELPLARDLPQLFLITAAVALFLETISGFQSGRGASLVRLVLAVAGALFGGTIYHLSRAHIRFLLGR